MQKLSKSKKNIIHADIACQVCGQKGATAIYDFVYHNGHSQIIQCIHCKHLFMHPVPLTELAKRTMDGVEDAELFGNTLLKNLHKKLVIEKEIRIAKKYLPQPTPRLLDIGCGTGWTTAVWKTEGFDVTGLEPSENRRRIAEERLGIKVSSEHLENFRVYELFDIVIMRHLFEHIAEPAAMLSKVRAFLKPGGLLLIIIPNINCIGRYLFQENWEWVLPWHLHFYTPRTLQRLLERNGFEKLKIYQSPSPLWYPHTLNKALFGENSKFKFPAFVALALSLPIVFTGALFNLNDNMTLIFRRSHT